MIGRYAIIVGGMKCGTTALFHALGQHPAIALAKEKEPAFFTSDRKFERGMDWYDQLWDWDPERHAWAVEASTAYTKLPVQRSAAPWAARTGRDFRFVYVVRDPIERIRSHYLHMLTGDYGLRPITEGICVPAVAFSNYWQQVRPYLEFFGRSRVHVVSYARLRGAPTEVVAEVLRFLDLDVAPIDVRPPGPRNSSDDYLKLLLRQQAMAAGVPAPSDATCREPRFSRFATAWARSLTNQRDLDLLSATLRRLPALYVPSDAQAREVRGLLGDDLARFADWSGIDAWACG